MADSNQYDAIVIGSGIGGLTTAAILSKLNHKKVLVLEQHFIVGGFTQEFKRKGFQWDVGIHVVGGMGEGDAGRTVFDYITDRKVKWQKIPLPAEKIVYPDIELELAQERHPYESQLVQLFPEEKLNIERYFSDLERISKWYALYQMVSNAPRWLLPVINIFTKEFGKLIRMTTKEYLDQHFQDQRLKAILASQWGLIGLPPSQSAFAIHALIMGDYSGGYCLVGGAQQIADSIVPIIERGGGKVLTQRQVTEIIVENGAAKGVKARKTHQANAELEEYYAPAIISDAGAFNTYTKLIPEDYAQKYRNQIDQFPKGYSSVILFLGLKDSPQTLGIKAGNQWIYNNYDHDGSLQAQFDSSETINSCFLSLPSLKDPTIKHHTAQIIVLAEDYKKFSKWQGQPWRQRDADYYELKQRIAQSMIRFVEGYYPGFQDLIEYYDLATPLTVEYFDFSEQGAIYGIPWVPCNFNFPFSSITIQSARRMTLGR